MKSSGKHSRASPAARSTWGQHTSLLWLWHSYMHSFLLVVHCDCWTSPVTSPFSSAGRGKGMSYPLRFASFSQDRSQKSYITLHYFQRWAGAGWYQLVKALALPKSVFSAIRVEAWNYPRWDDLYHGMGKHYKPGLPPSSSSLLKRTGC